MPIAHRIVKRRHASGAFDGEGARLIGGRWNTPGTPIVYASEHLSLAVLEIFVHLRKPRALDAYVRTAVTIDEEDVEVLDDAVLPKDWRNFPAPSVLQTLGDGWVRGRSSLALSVPSAVLPSERNLLLNPLHPRATSWTLERPAPLGLDPGVFGRSLR